MNQRNALGVPPEVRRVREQFEEWRRSKHGQERIPARLWRGAVKLCREQSAYRIARWLRLNDVALRERVRRAAARGNQPRPKVAQAPRFLELEMAAAPGTTGGSALSLAPEYVLEARGVRVRVRGAPVAEVAALARALGTGAGTGTDEGEAAR